MQRFRQELGATAAEQQVEHGEAREPLLPLYDSRPSSPSQSTVQEAPAPQHIAVQMECSSSAPAPSRPMRRTTTTTTSHHQQQRRRPRRAASLHNHQSSTATASSSSSRSSSSCSRISSSSSSSSSLQQTSIQQKSHSRHHHQHHHHNKHSSRATKTTSSTTTAMTTHIDIARIHSGSAVAGFVVGTTFEACLMGLVAFLQFQNTPQQDYPLCLALLSLLVVAWWTGIFHVVLYHIDALLDLVAAAGSTNNNNNENNDHHKLWTLYGHFNGGLALGMGLECTILHSILSRLHHHTRANHTPTSTTLLGVVSIVFAVGCMGLTLVRITYDNTTTTTTTTTTKQQAEYAAMV